MSEVDKKVKELIDPIELLLEEIDGGYMDNYIVHLCSWSDVVKNDLREALNRHNESINKALHKLLTGAVDGNGRYSYDIPKGAQDKAEAFSGQYVRVQCLLSEWLCIYRAVAIYIDAQREFEGQVDLENFKFNQ